MRTGEIEETAKVYWEWLSVAACNIEVSMGNNRGNSIIIAISLTLLIRSFSPFLLLDLNTLLITQANNWAAADFTFQLILREDQYDYFEWSRR